MDNPGFTPVDRMEYLICGGDKNTSYDYLFNVGPRQRMETARLSREKKLKETKTYYDQIMKPDIIKTTWINELKELNKVINKGTTDDRGWLYNENKTIFK